MQITVVCGPPGSGKSTFVKSNMVAGDVVWDHDLIAAALTGLPVHQATDEFVRLVIALRFQFIQWVRSYAASRGTAWIIVTSRSTANEIAAMLRGELIPMNTPIEECRRRLIKDNRLKPRHELLFMKWSGEESDDFAW